LPGGTVTVTGKNFDANATVKLTLHSKTYLLATVTTSATGTFSVDVKMPAGVFGHHLIIATGGNADPATGCPKDPVQIVQIQTGPTSAGSSSSGGTGGGTAFTGLDVLALLIAAAALIGVGLVLNRRGGKRTRPWYEQVNS
jgi:hypothetical protein